MAIQEKPSRMVKKKGLPEDLEESIITITSNFSFAQEDLKARPFICNCTNIGESRNEQKI